MQTIKRIRSFLRHASGTSQAKWTKALLVGLATCNVAPLVYAQSQQSNNSPAQSSAGASDDSDVLQEVYVTANRREQKLQDVGVAETALSGQDLLNLDIKDSTDLTKVVPELKQYAFSDSGVVYTIRGVSQNDFSDAAEPPIAVYQDDSYESSIAFTGFPTFDLQRAEVLRGPQGTLFGRNATGGAIQFISNKPTKDMEGYVTLTYGKYNQKIIEGAISGPLTDNLQIRVAAVKNDAEGYLTNIGGGPDENAVRYYAGRVMVDWQPVEGTDVLWTTRYLKNDHEYDAGGYSGEPSYVDAQGQGTYLPPNMKNPLANAYFPGNNFGPGTDAGGYRNDAINHVRGGDPFTIATSFPGFFDRDIYSTTLHIDQELGAFNLVSITDYQYVNKYFQEAADGTPNTLSRWIVNTKVDQLSQELRLSGHFANNFLTVGAYGLQVLGNYAAGYQLPVIDYYPFSNKKLDTTSFAFFTQDEWSLSDKFKLIGGVRYWHDHKTLDYQAYDNFGDLVVVNSHEIYPSVPGITPSFAQRSFQDFTMKLELDYKPVDSVLLYASYNRGSKAGGFTTPDDPPSAGGQKIFIQDLPYKSETLHSFEIGAKATILPGTTFDVAAFHYIYNNYQAYSIVGTAESIFNKDARDTGVEADLTTHPVKPLTLRLSAAYLDTEVLNVQLPDGSIVNHSLPEAPHFSGDAMARYEFNAGPGHLYLQADGQYTGKSCFTVLCAPVEVEHAYGTLDARMGYATKHFDFAVYVDNVTNRIYRIYAVDVAAIAGTTLSDYARPRYWAVTGTYRF